ncbi:MAG: multiprotein bridging factor aMBF1 [Nitrososphaeraceae archaeon]|jgi:putative transcription factor|nr:multiprotein bridging factor aMBF1 [Nitrososphaeraceae archaeon]MDW0134803.1 multiprotein bridging factor aMBF1 [Nitrososphaeraceae archaeon]
MASCEICGTQILDYGEKVYVEGNLITVCKTCSKRGKPSKNQQEIQRKPAMRPKKIEKLDKITFDDSAVLINNFSEVIRNSRMANGLTHEQLGLLIKERVSLLRKIESGTLKPDEGLSRKLERFFRINLYTEVESNGGE